MGTKQFIITMGLTASLIMTGGWQGTTEGQMVSVTDPDSDLRGHHEINGDVGNETLLGEADLAEVVNPKENIQSPSNSPSPSMISAEKQSKKRKSDVKFSLPVYKPPKGIGAPGGRVGGGSRGPSQDSLVLFALVPNHLGLTLQEQPILYWYLSKPARHRLVLTVNDERLVKPILETTLTTEPKQGIHSTRLQDYNIRLELDTEYQWFVELAVDADYPSKNIVAGGRIQRIIAPEGLLDRLRNAEPQQVTAIYSEAGLWYDALASISDLIDKSDNGTQYRVGRKALLEQVDLMEVAKAEEEVPPPGDSLYWDNPEFRSIFANSLEQWEESQQ